VKPRDCGVDLIFERDWKGDDDEEASSAETKLPRLNEYVLHHVIGKGAYGVVRLVEDTTDHKFYVRLLRGAPKSSILLM
jgi:hypothetical protein